MIYQEDWWTQHRTSRRLCEYIADCYNSADWVVLMNFTSRPDDYNVFDMCDFHLGEAWKMQTSFTDPKQSAIRAVVLYEAAFSD